MADETTTPATGLAQEVAQEIAFGLWDQGIAFLSGLLRPWNAYQVLIAIALFAVAHFLAKLLAPRFHDWLRGREGWPKWRMRFALQFHRRMRLIIYVGLIWPVVWIMRASTWPSRSYLLAGVAELAFGWLVIAILTRTINNGFLRAVVRYAGWTWLTLSVLDLTDEAQRLLDSAAIELGTMHLSLWLLVQAAFTLGLLFAIARFFSTTGSSSIKRNEDISPSMKVLAIKFLQVTLYGVAAFVGLRAVGVDLTGLAFLSGAIGLGLGFGIRRSRRSSSTCLSMGSPLRCSLRRSGRIFWSKRRSI